MSRRASGMPVVVKWGIGKAETWPGVWAPRRGRSYPSAMLRSHCRHADDGAQMSESV